MDLISKGKAGNIDGMESAKDIKRARKVFVVQKPYRDLDLSSAMAFGEIEFVFDTSDMPSLYPDHCFQKACDKLKNMQDVDYLVAAGGDPAALICCIAVICRFHSDLQTIKYLRWERDRDNYGARVNAGRYVPTKLVLNMNGEAL